jgi:hypothetical protein
MYKSIEVICVTETHFSSDILDAEIYIEGFSMFRNDSEIPKWIDGFKKDSIFIDIGANIGMFSLYAAKKNHKVIAFEPESLNFACLKYFLHFIYFNLHFLILHLHVLFFRY